MNLPLLDLAEVQAPLPEVIEDKLTVADDVVVCTFNRRGNLLAGGCRNGMIVVWDFDTHGVAQTFTQHRGRITSISWTRSSRLLLSSSVEGTLILWDVVHGSAVHTVNLGGDLIHAALHPRSRSLALVCVTSSSTAGQAFLIGLDPSAKERTPLLTPQSDPSDTAGSSQQPNATFACFTHDGSMALVGTSRGTVHVVRTQTQEELIVLRMPGGAAIKSLMSSPDGKSVLTNSSDRVIRAYSLEKILSGERPQPRELQDVVNRVQWAHAGFSSESEHVVGTANSATDHLVYIWDMHGHLAHILGQGEKVNDGALHFACHPTRPILAVCARSGAVYVWTKKYSENWSAFAPDFKELEENEEYAEREDEFDIKPTAELERQVEEVEEVIDIVTMEHTELAHVPDADGTQPCGNVACPNPCPTPADRKAMRWLIGPVCLSDRADDAEELFFLPTVPDYEKKKAAAATDGGGDGKANGAVEDADADGSAAKGGGKTRGGKRKLPEA